MISPKIVRVISETLLNANCQFESVHMANLRGRADEDWIMTFARTGGHAIVSADQKMLKRQTLLQSISATGLIAFYLPPSWAEARRDEQLAYIAHWWRKIEIQASMATPGSVWIVPKGFGGSELRQFKAQRRSNSRTQPQTRDAP